MAKSNIIDPKTGQPFEKAALDTVQTDEARISGLSLRYDEHPSSGLTPHRLAQIMTDAEQHQLTDQAELAADMEEKDGHIFAELQKRKLALTTVAWKITPPVNATKQEAAIAEWLTERLAHLDMAEIIMDMADAILKGYAAQTIEWQLIEGSRVPVNLEWVPQSWFMTPFENHNQLQLIGSDGLGQDLWPGGWVVHQHKSKSGYLGRAGLVRALAWPYLFKNYSLRDLAEFLEIYGLPLRLGKYPSGATDNEKSRLLQAVVEIGHNAAGIIPDSMALEFKEAAKGQSEPFLALVNWAERTISKAILGATLTSGTDSGGAYALGQIHNEVRYDIRDADLRQIAKTLSRDLLWPMVVFNQNGIHSFFRCPKFEFITEEAEDIKLLADSIPKLQQMGMSISKKWLHKQTQIPEPEDEDEEDILQSASVQAANTAALVNESAVNGCQCGDCKTAALNAQPQSITAADKISSDLETAADPAATDLVEQLRVLVETAESFEGMQQGLLDLANQDMSQMADLLAQAMVLAELQGRYDVFEEALSGV
ncbi:MAG: hypothetical protein COW76_20480 [Shewanella sp. CG18_big_fil_WC_8_21_14_2_50_42_11]|uniref:DUF935 domain-containing protein n=1 Tax=Shewanella sp. CG18_big_fil_WC_8_21_14_2_50_42_11 TaxID=1975538 RepID=UPI000C4CC8A2|nr:DUF935 domain-containing protein [Shewanella sp. CG18_big_fil_WC_8_21_14_2_50_42_11]PIP98541.1 MAG: hypothetical protein COW76_20480 [Shewanella sp. CG18_big_fil_WC_8_21_14_2_50_42_11]